MKYSKTQLFTVRPSLVAQIIEAGGNAEPTTNALFPDKHAWLVSLDATSVGIIEEFYQDIGQELPRAVREWKEAHRAEVDA